MRASGTCSSVLKDCVVAAIVRGLFVELLDNDAQSVESRIRISGAWRRPPSSVRTCLRRVGGWPSFICPTADWR
jgi:hypothetical protein